MPGVGDAVPDFSLKDHTGAEAEDQFLYRQKTQMKAKFHRLLEVSLKSLKESGKKTLIWFYPKAGITREIQRYVAT